MTAHASADEIAELLGEATDEAIVERIADTGASLDEIQEALDELEFQRRFGEIRSGSTRVVDDVRAILEELPVPVEEPPIVLDEDQDEALEGLRVIDADESPEHP